MALGFTDWGRALGAGLPEGVRHAFGIGARILRADADPGAGGLRLTDAATGQTIAVGERARRLAQSARRPAIALVLSRSEAVEASLTVPETARQSLDEVIDAEIGRVTPFRADDVHVARSVRRAGVGQLGIDLLVIPREAVRTRLASLEIEGVRPDFVTFEAGSAPELRRLAIIQPGPGRLGGSARLLPILAVASLAAAVASPFLHQEWKQRALVAELDAQAPAVERVLGITDKIERLDADRQAFSAAFGGGERGQMPAMLEELSILIPDNGHLHRFELRNRKLTLEGRIPRAAPLLAAIERNPAFSSAAFDAPVLRDPATGDERFRITAELAPPDGDGS